MPRYYITVGPQFREECPSACRPTWIIDAADESAARDRAEVTYRRSYLDVLHVGVRVTPARLTSSGRAR
jgi:hypothetical protein